MMDFKDVKFWQLPKGELTTLRLIDEPAMRFFDQHYIKPQQRVHDVLDPSTFFDRYEVIGEVQTIEDRPGCTCDQCEKRRANGMKQLQRYHLPVIDIETQKQMMLSVPMTARRALAEILERWQKAEETAEFIRLQQAAARRFKIRKMVYGAKR